MNITILNNGVMGMSRHVFLPAIDQGQFFCFPDSIGHYHLNPYHKVDRQTGELPMFNLHLVASGAGCAEVDGRVYPLKQGDLFLYFPGQAQHYYSSEEEPWEVYWIHFYGIQVSEYLKDRGFAQFPLWTLRQCDSLIQLFEALLHGSKESGGLQSASISMLTYGLLAEFVFHAEPLALRRGNNASEKIMELLPILEKEATQPFDLDKWAMKAGMSTSYFCRSFKKVTQRTPMEFITICRLRLAKQLLLEAKEKSVIMIAESCGYPSTSYFIKRFREHEGITPTEYRNLYI